jgi:putative tryptophan/tyrosine transport system substrate-binding protein
VDRRSVLKALCGGLAGPCLPVAAASERRRVGWLSPLSREGAVPWLRRFESRMAELGWNSSNIYYDYKYIDGNIDRAKDLAQEIFDAKPSVAVTYNTRIAQIMRETNHDVPMVVFVIDDPVRAGLATDLIRPGMNTTGVYWKIDSIVGKQISLLQELTPRVRQLGLLAPDGFSIAAHLNAVMTEATRKGFEISQLRFRDKRDLAEILLRFKDSGGDAVYVMLAPLTAENESNIAEISSRAKLIAIGEQENAVKAGMLFSYTARRGQSERLIAEQVDRVLKGQDPNEIPFVQPVEFFLTWNSKTAGLLDLVPPTSFQAQIDEIVD